MAEERLVGDGECVSMAIAVPFYIIEKGKLVYAGENYVPGCQHMKVSFGVIKKGDGARGYLIVDKSIPGASRHLNK